MSPALSGEEQFISLSATQVCFHLTPHLRALHFGPIRILAWGTNNWSLDQLLPDPSTSLP